MGSIGSVGAVRSRAWIWGFSSTAKTTAASLYWHQTRLIVRRTLAALDLPANFHVFTGNLAQSTELCECLGYSG